MDRPIDIAFDRPIIPQKRNESEKQSSPDIHTCSRPFELSFGEASPVGRSTIGGGAPAPFPFFLWSFRFDRFIPTCLVSIKLTHSGPRPWDHPPQPGRAGNRKPNLPTAAHPSASLSVSRSSLTPRSLASLHTRVSLAFPPSIDRKGPTELGRPSIFLLAMQAIDPLHHGTTRTQALSPSHPPTHPLHPRTQMDDLFYTSDAPSSAAAASNLAMDPRSVSQPINGLGRGRHRVGIT